MHELRRRFAINGDDDDDTLHGDFGTSFQTNQPVSTMMWAALPNTPGAITLAGEEILPRLAPVTP
mgnify:CR=1 FL=1